MEFDMPEPIDFEIIEIQPAEGLVSVKVQMQTLGEVPKTMSTGYISVRITRTDGQTLEDVEVSARQAVARALRAFSETIETNQT